MAALEAPPTVEIFEGDMIRPEMLGPFFMVLFDATITIVALSSIGTHLDFSDQALQWVLSMNVSKGAFDDSGNRGDWVERISRDP